MGKFELERTAQVWGITGNLGGGKTLTAVQFAVDAMSQGYFVCTNITLDQDRIAAFYGEFTRKLYLHISLDDPAFDPFKLPTGSPRGSGGKKRVLIILDECAEWVDQYSSAKDPRISRLWSWLRHSSKRSQDVFVIVQRPDYLNKVIRILITRWIWVHDLAVWRIPVLKIRMPFCSGLVMRNIFDNMKNRIGMVSYCSKSFWGQFYNTAECLNQDGSTYNVEYEKPEFEKSGRFWIALLLIASQVFLCRSCLSVSRISADVRFPLRALPPDLPPPPPDTRPWYIRLFSANGHKPPKSNYVYYTNFHKHDLEVLAIGKGRNLCANHIGTYHLPPTTTEQKFSYGRRKAAGKGFGALFPICKIISLNLSNDFLKPLFSPLEQTFRRVGSSSASMPRRAPRAEFSPSGVFRPVLACSFASPAPARVTHAPARAPCARYWACS